MVNKHEKIYLNISNSSRELRGNTQTNKHTCQNAENLLFFKATLIIRQRSRDLFPKIQVTRNYVFITNVTQDN